MDLAKLKKMQEIIIQNNYEFSDEQMDEIHIGMEKEVDFLIYLNPVYTPAKMALIRDGLINGYDVSKYTDINLTYEQMRIIYDSLSVKEDPVKTTVISEPEIKKTHVHDYEVSILKLSSCVEPGIKRYTCSCGEFYEEEMPKKEHNFTSMKILPTCRTKGYTNYKCIACGYSYNGEEVPFADHTYDNTILEEPTCNRVGKMKHVCINCQNEYIDDIPTIAHKYESKEIAPTCIELGYTLNTCIMCGQAYRSNEKDKIPHAFTDWERIKNSTCSEKGIEERTCLRCKNKETKFIDPVGHKYETRRIEPTCKEPGQILQVCSVCGHSEVESIIEKSPHKYGEWEIIKKPTIYEKGLRKRVCIVCSFVEEEKMASKKLTMQSAQENALEKIYEKQKKNKIKVLRNFDGEVEYTPLLAKYSREDFERYVEKSRFDFSPEEVLLIEEGLRAGLDVKIYANDTYSIEIMQELKTGVEHGLDLSKYAKNYDSQQINQIRLGIEHDIDFKKYLNPNFSATQMNEIRLALEDNLDVSKMIALDGVPVLLSGVARGKMFQPRYSSTQMYKMRMELLDKAKK